MAWRWVKRTADMHESQYEYDSPFLHVNGQQLLAQFGRDRERQRNHIIPARHSSEHPDVRGSDIVIPDFSIREPGRQKRLLEKKRKDLEGGLRVCHAIQVRNR